MTDDPPKKGATECRPAIKAGAKHSGAAAGKAAAQGLHMITGEIHVQHGAPCDSVDESQKFTHWHGRRYLEKQISEHSDRKKRSAQYKFGRIAITNPSAGDREQRAQSKEADDFSGIDWRVVESLPEERRIEPEKSIHAEAVDDAQNREDHGIAVRQARSSAAVRFDFRGAADIAEPRPNRGCD